MNGKVCYTLPTWHLANMNGKVCYKRRPFCCDLLRGNSAQTGPAGSSKQQWTMKLGNTSVNPGLIPPPRPCMQPLFRKRHISNSQAVCVFVLHFPRWWKRQTFLILSLFKIYKLNQEYISTLEGLLGGFLSFGLYAKLTRWSLAQ